MQRSSPGAIKDYTSGCCGPKFEANNALPEPASQGERPCQATANVVLGLLQTILEERAEASGGALSMEEIRQVIEQFMEAPGQLKSFYDETKDHCLSAERASEREDFEAKIRALAGQESGSVTLGRLQLVGLQAVRTKLGDRWPEVFERVRRTAETVVRRRLVQSDSYLVDPNGDILVCFGELTGQEAWFKANQIENEISEHLLGCDGQSDLSQIFVDFETLSLASEVTAETHDLTTPLAGLGSAADIGALVVEQLEEAGRAMRRRADHYLEQLERFWRVVPRAINVHSGAPARIVIADLGNETTHILQRLLPIVRGEPEQLVKIDLLAIAAAARFLSEDEQLDGNLLAVCIHAASITDEAAFNEFASACAGMAPEVRERLILVLDDLPRDLSTAGLAEALGRLRQFARLHAVRLKVPRLDVLHLQATRVPLVLLDYGPAAALLRSEPNRYRSFHRDLQDCGARLLVDLVPEPKAIEPLLEAGLELWSLDPRGRTARE